MPSPDNDVYEQSAAVERAKPNVNDAIVEAVVIHGNLAELEAAERVAYYRAVCESVGLNPYTRPFEYITLSGRLTLYARKDCTDQLRDLHQISVRIAAKDLLDEAGLYVVVAHAATPAGRVDESTGVVATVGLKGEALANAMMKAETKAKRRVTLSICGLGWLDETEIESTPGVKTHVDPDTGEITKTGGPERRQLPQATRPGYVTAAVAKHRLIDAYTARGMDRPAATAAAAAVWGKRGSRQITVEHLDQLVAAADIASDEGGSDPGAVGEAAPPGPDPPSRRQVHEAAQAGYLPEPEPPAEVYNRQPESTGAVDADQPTSYANPQP